MRMLLQLPGFRLLTCAQGLLGATSTKRTGLLALNLPYLHFDLRDNAVCKELPKHTTIGLDEAGHFRTAVLKEYPPALCKALAESFLRHLTTFPSVSEQGDPRSLPEQFFLLCRQMTCTTMGTHIGADCAVR